MQAWRAAVCSEDAAQRLSDYAVAMHHLATRYWDPVRDTTNTVTGTTTEDAADGLRPSSCVGEKRAREEAMPRHYSDRLQCCLDYTAAYFLGDVTATLPHTEAAESTDVVCSASSEERPTSRPPLVVPVNDVVFGQLPGVMARVVKPLRRFFFDQNGRMATGAEVSELLQACTPAAAASSPAFAVDSCADEKKEKEEHGDVTAVQRLTTTHPAAQLTVEESTWRRGAHTAWAAALRYTRTGGELATATPPLWVLDIGSCYGPFKGKSLVRPPPLPAVPLCVTAIDLAPYTAGEPVAWEGTPAPRVWQGDWLHMDFFSPEETAVAVKAGAAVKCAEEGRVWYCPPAQAAQDASQGDSAASLIKERSTNGVSHPPPLSVAVVQLESYDAVYFCLLLSYIPTPRLRFLACLHACLALKEGGLLVIVSTRTQGSRRRNWVQEWVACLAAIGFHRVQQSTQEKIVGMAFAKASPSEAVRASWRTAEGRAAWVRSMMATAAAESGLRITADDTHERAEI